MVFDVYFEYMGSSFAIVDLMIYADFGAMMYYEEQYTQTPYLITDFKDTDFYIAYKKALFKKQLDELLK